MGQERMREGSENMRAPSKVPIAGSVIPAILARSGGALIPIQPGLLEAQSFTMRFYRFPCIGSRLKWRFIAAFAQGLQRKPAKQVSSLSAVAIEISCCCHLLARSFMNSHGAVNAEFAAYF